MTDGRPTGSTTTTSRPARRGRWWRLLLWLLVLPVVAYLIVPPAMQLWQSRQPVPLPSQTWSLRADQVQVTQATLPRPLRPSTIYIPALDLTMPYHDSGESRNHVIDLDHDLGTAIRFTGAGTFTRGSMVLAAHVNDKHLHFGPFVRINDTKPGMLLVVTDAAGKPHRYKATGLETYIKEDLPEDVWRTDGSPTLVLATCGGPRVHTSDGRSHYSSNVVVRGVPA